jgi:hypothetical protein
MVLAADQIFLKISSNISGEEIEPLCIPERDFLFRLELPELSYRG